MKDNIKNHEEVRARRTKRFAEMLLQVTNDLAKTKSLDEALETLVNITTSSIGAERGTIFLNDKSTGELYSRVAQGNFRREIRILNTKGVAGWVFTKNEGVIIHDSAHDLFRTCTHISIHCNLTEETRGMVNSDMISNMTGIGADGTVCGNHIVSCARGGIVDEESASDALRSGQLTSLALDVFDTEPLDDSPLLSHDGFHGSPHIAASTVEAQSRIGSEMASLLLEFFESGQPSTSLNQSSLP